MHKYLIELSKIAESKGGKLISTEYSGAHSKYQFLDEEGNTFESKGYSIKNGRWSPHTAQKRKAESLIKYTIEDLKASALKKDGDCLSKIYTGYKSKYHWVDSKGRQFWKTYDEVLNGQWSPFEKAEKLSKLKTKYTIQDLKDYAASKGGECLSEEYTRLDDKYQWKDRNGAVFFREWSQVQRTNDLIFFQSSKPEKQLYEFITEELGIPAKRNDRSLIKPKELDIYIPDKNLAIELNGLLWHSEEFGKDRGYHLEKLDLCRKQKTSLVQIFENEWNYRTDQVKSFLRSKLGCNSRIIYARKTEIREVNKSEAKQFLKDYHIQGSCNFDKSFGLYFNDELLCLISISKHHRNNSEWVLSRFVGKTDVTVSGGLMRLTKHASKQYGKLVTWVDLRYSDGSNWLKSGWNLENVLKPDYFYICKLDSRKVIPKQSRKKSVVGTSSEMTEWEHAKLDGLTRVWDCGKLKLSFIP